MKRLQQKSGFLVLFFRMIIYTDQFRNVEHQGLTLIPFGIRIFSMVFIVFIAASWIPNDFPTLPIVFFQAKEFKHIVITHGTDTLIETAKYLGSRSTEGDADSPTGFVSFSCFFLCRQLLKGLTPSKINATCQKGVMEMC